MILPAILLLAWGAAIEWFKTLKAVCVCVVVVGGLWQATLDGCLLDTTVGLLNDLWRLETSPDGSQVGHAVQDSPIKHSIPRTLCIHSLLCSALYAGLLSCSALYAMWGEQGTHQAAFI